MAQAGEDAGASEGGSLGAEPQEGAIISYLQAHGSTSPSELLGMLSLGASGTREVLPDMVSRGLLVHIGKTSSTRYALPDKN